MPEGDTLHRTAARLRPALEGAELVRFEAPRLVGDKPHVGARIERVEAVGKHLLIHFSDGITLQTHLRMSGSWHLYRAGERWQRPAHLMRALVAVDGWEAVCFSAPVVQTFRPAAPQGVTGSVPSDPTAHLGPDLCLPDADIDLGLARMATIADASVEIANVLMDQRVVAGIGNVYKSEVLFACGVDPFAALGAVDEPTRRALLETAARMLQANLGTGARTTMGPPGSGMVAVYGRQRQPCRRCGTLILMRRQGPQSRTTYWCPVCQKTPAG